MITDDPFETWGDDDPESADQTERRQRADLAHIRYYYDLEQRCGIRVELNARVRHRGREGTIVDTAGPRLLVLRDGDEKPVLCHVTSDMEYADSAGEWVPATPIPDPCTELPPDSDDSFGLYRP